MPRIIPDGARTRRDRILRAASPMFELLINVLLVALVAAIGYGIFQKIPPAWFKFLGWFLAALVTIVGYLNLRAIERPIPKLLIDILTFPFAIAGFLLITAWILWRQPHKIRGNKDVDNNGVKKAIASGATAILFLFAIASNNAISDLLVASLEKQGDDAAIQSFRRLAPTLNQRSVELLRSFSFDAIVVTGGATRAIPPRNALLLPDLKPADRPWDVALTETGDRLLAAARVWRLQEGEKPLIFLSAGTESPPRSQLRGLPVRPDNYPCGLAVAVPPDQTEAAKAEARDRIAGALGLRFDTRLAGLFLPPPETGPLPDPKLKVPPTEADDMCAFLADQPANSIPRRAMVLGDKGTNLRRSAEEIRQLLGQLKENRLIPPETEPTESYRLLLVTPALEAARAFWTFRRLGLNVTIYPTSYRVNPAERPWPLRGSLKDIYLKTDYLMFSAEAFRRSELAWSEVKELILYALRLWIRPPLTDEAPYYPLPATSPPAAPTAPPPPAT